MFILSGDIGGTNTRLQLTEFASTSESKVISQSRYKNVEYTSLVEIIDIFLNETAFDQLKISSVCFAIAGPVVNDEVKITNLPWVVKTSDLKDKFKMDKIALINDFVAVGYGLETLKTEELETLQVGKHKVGGIKAYMGAGTGLGVGFMTMCQNWYKVYPTEGGHIDFAPTDGNQIELLKFLQKKYNRVSFERLLSGIGIVNIYRFVRENPAPGEKENPDLKKVMEGEQDRHTPKAITKYAIEHDDPMANRALNIFIDIYGSAAGNLGLTTLPYGGLYIVGGIAPKIISQIKNNGFLKNFTDKGRLSDMLKDIPVHVVLNADVGLQGAAAYGYTICCPRV